MENKKNSSLAKIVELLEQQKSINSYLIEQLKKNNSEHSEENPLEKALNSLNVEYDTVVDTLKKDFNLSVSEVKQTPNSEDVVESKEQENTTNISQTEEIKEINSDLNESENKENDIKDSGNSKNEDKNEPAENQEIPETVTTLEESSKENSINNEKFKSLANLNDVEMQDNKKVSSALSLANPLLLFKNKQYIHLLKKNYTSILQLIGFTPTELGENPLTKDYKDSTDVLIDINEELEKMKFYKDDITQVYKNHFLTHLDDTSKVQTIYNILWPNIHKKLKEIVHTMEIVGHVTETNRYLSILNNFCKKNNLNQEEVVNILFIDPESCDSVFADKKGIEKIKENYINILKNVEKFTILMKNSKVALESYISVIEDMKTQTLEMNIADSDKQSFINAIDKSRIYKDKEKEIFYKTLKKNLNFLSMDAPNPEEKDLQQPIKATM